MSRARDFADLAGSADAGGLTGRNLVINGDFQIWQRGTSQTTVGYGSADRWRLNVSGATLTGSQGTFTDGQTAVPGNPRFYLALDVTTGNDNAGWFHRLEGTHEFANDVYTLSFWAKSDTPRAMTVGSNSHDLSADVFQDNTVSPTTFTPTSSWQKFTFKVTHSSMNTLGSFASGDYTAFFITQGSDTSTAAWKLDLALVQFEKGEVATPFEHRSYADELQRCRRYLYRIETDTANGAFVNLNGWDTNNTYGSLRFPVEMRAAPSFSYGAALSDFLILSAGANYTPTTIQSNGNNKHGIELNMVSTSNITAGRSYWARMSDTTNGFIQFDAEL